MPFDFQSSQPDLTCPSLSGLSWLLRHPGAWPNHRWNFTLELIRDAPSTDPDWWKPRAEEARTIGTVGCALGLAHRVWPQVQIGTARCAQFNATLFRMDAADYFAIFYDVPHHVEITPEMVADRIDDYLETGLLNMRLAMRGAYMLAASSGV